MFCPECGSLRILSEYTCHTYEGAGGRFYACLPCDSAIEYFCEDCHWTYTHGLNKNNPRSIENEKNKPYWILD